MIRSPRFQLFVWGLAALFWELVLICLGTVFFAGTIFALLIREEKKSFQAYDSNLLGAVMGGALEHSSMAFGFKMLYGFALVLCLPAFFCLRSAAKMGLEASCIEFVWP